MSFSTIRTKIRSLLNEGSKTGTDIFTYESSDIFSISEDRVISVSDVLVNDVSIGSGNWTYSSTTNKVTIASGVAITAGDTIQINYSYYPNYSDTELNGYIQAAISHIAVNNYQTFQVDGDDINPEPTEAEENLIAVVVGVIINPENKSYTVQELRVQVPSSSLSTHDKIAKIVNTFKRNSHGVFSVIINNYI